MPQKVLDAAFLERCCVQLSAPLSASTPPNATDAMRYLLHHAPTHSDECASALAFRVAWSAPGDDRFGAWALLDATIRASIAEQQKCAASRPHDDANDHQIDGATTHLDTSGAADSSLTNGHSRPAAAVVTPWQNFQNVLHHYLIPLVRSAWDESVASSDLEPRYRALRVGWQSLFNSVVTKQLRQAVSEREEKSNVVHSALRISDALMDALWKLRREAPRPSTVEYLIKCFGLSDDVCKSIVAGKGTAAHRADASLLHVDAKVLAWISKYYNTAQCLQCDTWDHSALVCPATASRVAQLKPILRSHAVAVLQAHAPKALNCGPIRSVEAASHVLDALHDRLLLQQPYETLLQSFDTLRRETTSAQTRAALHLLVSYKLRPSKVALHTNAKDEDASASPTMKKVKAHLVDKERRIREYLALERAARIVAAEFRGAIPDVVRRWTANKSSFIFVPLGLSHWEPLQPLRKRPGQGSELPEEKIANAELPRLASAVALAPYKDIVDLMCRRCLDTQHRSAASCPLQHECPRDLQLAQSTLNIRFTGKENNKSDIQNILIDAAREIEDCRRDNSEPSQQLLTRLCAARALRCVEARDEVVPYCGRCSCLGHEREECEQEIQKVLNYRRLLDLHARVMPYKIESAIDGIRRSLKHHEEQEAKLGSQEDPSDEAKRELMSKMRAEKGDMKVLELLIKAARNREPQFSREMHTQLRSMDEILANLKRQSSTQNYFSHGLASFIFAPTLSEEILFLLDQDASCLRVLRDSRLPLDEVMQFALLTHPSSTDRHQTALFPEAGAIKLLVDKLAEHCLGLNDVFCEESRRSSAAVAFAKNMMMEVDGSRPLSPATTFRHIESGISQIVTEMIHALSYLRANRRTVSVVADVPTVPAVHSAAASSPVISANGGAAVGPGRRSRSPGFDTDRDPKAHRAEFAFVQPQHAAAVLHGESL